MLPDLAFSPDGSTLVSGSYDGTILLWEMLDDEVPQDVNGDGSVNIEDLRFIAAHFGHVGKGNAADVNDDGVVNILDLVAVTKQIKLATDSSAAR